jgi:hypothetical protein
MLQAHPNVGAWLTGTAGGFLAHRADMTRFVREAPTCGLCRLRKLGGLAAGSFL